MSKPLSRTSILPLLALASLTPACFFSTAVEPAKLERGQAAGTNRAPLIAAFDYSPKSGIGKNDFITFTLVASDPEQQVLTYTWTSTRGFMTANTGMTTSWRPLKTDGTVEPGLATITVVVSDGTQTSTASANIIVDASGQASVQGSPTIGASTATPSPSASAQPTPPAPSATVAPAASPSPAQPTGKVLFKEDFEAGLSSWTLARDTSFLKTSLIDPQAGQACATFGDADEKIADAGRAGRLVWKTVLDLSEATLPRLRFHLKNPAAMRVTVNWLDMVNYNPAIVIPYPAIHELGVFETSQKSWALKDIDLSAYKGKSGLLSFEFYATGSTLIGQAGPRLDTLSIYDAGK